MSSVENVRVDRGVMPGISPMSVSVFSSWEINMRAYVSETKVTASFFLASSRFHTWVITALLNGRVWDGVSDEALLTG